MWNILTLGGLALLVSADPALTPFGYALLGPAEGESRAAQRARARAARTAARAPSQSEVPPYNAEPYAQPEVILQQLYQALLSAPSPTLRGQAKPPRQPRPEKRVAPQADAPRNALAPFLAPVYAVSPQDIPQLKNQVLVSPLDEDTSAEESSHMMLNEHTENVQAEHEPSASVYQQPVIVDRQGGPLVIINQHPQSENGRIEIVGGDTVPTDYVPFALIHRDGRIAVLDTNRPANQPEQPSTGETSEDTENTPVVPAPPPPPAYSMPPPPSQQWLDWYRQAAARYPPAMNAPPPYMFPPRPPMFMGKQAAAQLRRTHEVEEEKGSDFFIPSGEEA